MSKRTVFLFDRNPPYYPEAGPQYSMLILYGDRTADMIGPLCATPAVLCCTFFEAGERPNARYKRIAWAKVPAVWRDALEAYAG